MHVTTGLSHFIDNLFQRGLWETACPCCFDLSASWAMNPLQGPMLFWGFSSSEHVLNGIPQRESSPRLGFED
jgi:hypothetical protein